MQVINTMWYQLELIQTINMSMSDVGKVNHPLPQKHLNCVFIKLELLNSLFESIIYFDSQGFNHLNVHSKTELVIPYLLHSRQRDKRETYLF